MISNIKFSSIQWGVQKSPFRLWKGPEPFLSSNWVDKQFSLYWRLNVLISLPGVKSAVPRRSSHLCRNWELEVFCFAHFSTITGEWFICIIKEQLERKMVTAFKGQTHFCLVLNYVRNEGLLNFDNCLPSAIAVFTIIIFRQDLGYKVKGSCKIFHKLTWLLKIRLDTWLWLFLHRCWNLYSVKGCQLH